MTGRESPARGPAPVVEESRCRSAWDAEPSREPPIVLEPGGGLDLAALADEPLAPPAPAAGEPGAPAAVQGWMAAARQRMALDDFSGALELVERVLAAEPGNAEARACQAQGQAALTAMYESKLGPMQRAPALQVRPDQVLWLNLDHRAGFLLAQVDGTVSYEDLFALSGLPRLETARILAGLVERKVIG